MGARRRTTLVSRLFAAMLATSFFVQQAMSAPADIFESAAPVIGSDPPKASEIKDGDASVSTQTGALTYSYSIQVPPGRNNMAPQLALAYSSQAPIYGTIAAGWSLSIPEIREDTSQGRLATHSTFFEAQQVGGGSDPKADDRFVSSLAGGRPLIKVADAYDTTTAYGAYRAQNDSSFARYERMKPGQPFTWRVRTTDGSVLLFGETSLTPGCTNVSEGYAPLTSATDVFGNSVFYEYQVGSSPYECRIKKITWGRNANAGLMQPFAKVELAYDSAGECPGGDTIYKGSLFDYRSGRKVVTGASKLRTITATAFPFGGEAAPVHTRQISLAYYDGDPTNTESCTAPHAPVRQLKSIQESAWGTDSPLVALPAITFQYQTAAINWSSQDAPVAPPWSEPMPSNLGWGYRPPDNATDKWPTVESMMVDLNGDGLVDRVYNAFDGASCQARWIRNQGPAEGSPSALPSFGSASLISLPRLRWRGAQTTIPNGGASAAATATPYYEGCALNGQATAYQNVLANHTVYCHDGDPGLFGNSCQASTNPKLAGQSFCYSNNEFGLECVAPGSGVGGNHRTYLAYRWLDMNGDGLTDLVAAVHGDIRFYDIVEGNDAQQSIDPAPFGPWPTCPAQFDRCLSIDRNCIDQAQDEASNNRCIATASMKPCSSLVTTYFLPPGSPSGLPPRTPYSRCEGLFPWMIYKNQGNGTFASAPIIKYSPVPLESDVGDSAISGPTISSQGHGVFDFDGDGRLDAVKVDEAGNNWQVWRGDGTGGFEPRVHVIAPMTSPWFSVAANGYPSSYGDNMSSAQGTFDLNGDGLQDRWFRLPAGNADVTWHRGLDFDTFPIPGPGPVQYHGSATTPTTPIALKPGNDAGFCYTAMANFRITNGDTFARNRIFDVDVDGRADIVDISSGACPAHSVTSVNSYFNFGGNFISNAVPWSGDTNGIARKAIAVQNQSTSEYYWQLTADMIDLDGDGIAESVAFPTNNLSRNKHSVANAAPRLLTVIDNGRGAQTQISYASMQDKRVVEQHPDQFWSDSQPSEGKVLPKASPHTQWVVRNIATTDLFSGTGRNTFQYYKNPRYAADDEGHYAFRGFEEVTTTATSGAKTVEVFDYTVDWSGRLIESRVHPAEALSEVRTIDKTTWTAHQLFGGAITTYHVASRDHYTCANGQTIATCTPSAAPGFTRTLVEQSVFSNAGTDLLWADTATTSQAGTSLADGDRRTTSTYAIVGAFDRYRFRPLTTTREHRVSGAWTMFGKTAMTWDSLYTVPLTDEVWLDTVDNNRAITRSVYDMQTGNVLERWKPEQNAANTKKTSYVYDARKLMVSEETNEVGHVREYLYEYGTGTKLTTKGPNDATCPINCPPGEICLAKEQHAIRVDGLGREIEQWDTTSDDGCTYLYYQRATTSYVDAISIAPPVPTSTTHKVKLDVETSVWTEEKTELDAHGRAIKKTVFVQGTAPVDQVTTFAYSSSGPLVRVEVPDPSANDATRVAYVYGYDSLDRPISIRRPDSTTPSQQSGVDIAYDGLTKTVSEEIGASGGIEAVTKTISDRFGRLVEVHEQTAASPPTWAVTHYSYGPDDLVSTVIDPEGVTTALVHDLGGRRTQIARAGRTWRYGYDKNGNMTSEQVPGSPDQLSDILYTTSIVYDDLDRPLSKLVGQRDISPADQTLFGGNTEAYFYDLNGNMKGQFRFWQSFAPNNPTPVLQLSVRVDNQGNRTETKHTFKGFAGYSDFSREFYQTRYLFGGSRLTYYFDQIAGSNSTESLASYDARGMLAKMQASTGTGPTQYNIGVQTRNVAGLVTKRRSTPVAGGPMNYVESNWTYDKLGRVLDQVVQKDPAPVEIARQSLIYYGNDDPAWLTTWLGTTSHALQFLYDSRHQLRSAEAHPAGWYLATYGYGDAGRLSWAYESQTMSPTPPGSEVQPRNVVYQYGGQDPEQVTALVNANSTTNYASFTYDAAGNMKSRCLGAVSVPVCTGESLEYVYDGKDQLRRVTKKNNGAVVGSEEYWYDGFGARMAIVRRDAGGAKTELVTFTGDTEAHFDGTGAIQYAYSHLSMGTPVARIKRTGNTTTSTEYQFHGLATSTLAAVASNGTINASFGYAPFGSIVEATDAGASNGDGVEAHSRRLNDKFVDDLSGLTYYGARYYDKTLIGWTQSDPLYRFAPDEAWTSPRHALLYTFSNNNPLRYIDPDGRSTTLAVGEAAASFEAVTATIAAAAEVAGPVGLVIGAAIIAAATVGDGIPSERQGMADQRLAQASQQSTAAFRQEMAENAAAREAFSSTLSENLSESDSQVASASGTGNSFATAKDTSPANPQTADGTRLGTAGGERAGKDFTQKGKREVKEHNKLANNGKCEVCGRKMKEAKQSKKGVTPSKDEVRVDHIVPKSEDGDGSPTNGRAICNHCNGVKSNKI